MSGIVRRVLVPTLLHWATWVGAVLCVACVWGCALPFWDDQLLMAAGNESPDGVTLALAHGADVNCVDAWGRTALHRAAQGGSVAVVQVLLLKGADPNAPAMGGMTPLAVAVQARSMDKVKALLAYGGDVRVRTIGGKTLLHLVAQEPIKVVGVPAADLPLRSQDVPDLSMAATLERQSRAFENTLTPAMTGEQREVFDALTSQGVMRGSAAAVARDLGSKQAAEIAALLIEKGVDVNARTVKGNTALHLVALSEPLQVEMLDANGDIHQLELPPSFRETQARVAELLICKGAAINVRNEEGRTPLHEAAFAGEEAVTQVLLRHGADVDPLDHQQQTPLDLATANGKLAVVRLLLKYGASLSEEDSEGRTPLAAR